ncbi:hypothetical protein HH308_16850 [Gordonia sp. TBRC 11910]|uniref:Aminoglycoside-2''-adenylyltransferase n=1 Tax=Gordonia asplenii TaxID=2725283 RepID=A0A848L2Q0_9ACTN|nr:hypothetical protein [Gordonia asplenii]NMO02883.1 hypothetical protein [Gordonia asplenii]
MTDLPAGGIPVDPDDCDRRWQPWTPNEIATRLDGCAASWCVVGGWAIDMFLGASTRPHDDVEIAVPRGQFDALAAHFGDARWDVVGSGLRWSFDEVGDDERLHQTWLCDPTSGAYHLDVFREPHDDDTWICRFDPSITLPYDDLIRFTRHGIPYATPEVVLLFKSRAPRPKDRQDFAAVLPHLSGTQRRRLGDWIRRNPEHRTIDLPGLSQLNS